MVTVLRRALFVTSMVLASQSAVTAATITLFTTESGFNAAVDEILIDDFESFAPKDVALPVIVHNGITYTPFAGAPVPNVAVASPGYTNFGAGVGTTTTSILTTSGDEDILAVLSSPQFAVGFDVYLNGLGPASATFFSGADVLGTITFPSDAADQQFAGILSDVAVTSFRWTSNLGARLNTGIDNVTFGTEVQAVPEPATLLLLGSGLIAAAHRRHRRKTDRS